MTSYRVYVTSLLTIPLRASRAVCDLGVLTTLEALLGVITACLPMARPVATKIWMSLPSSGRSKIRSVTTAMGSKVAWLSLPSFNHGSKSWDWFPSGSKEEHEKQESPGGMSRWSGKAYGDEKGEIWIESHFDVESVSSPHFLVALVSVSLRDS